LAVGDCILGGGRIAWKIHDEISKSVQRALVQSGEDQDPPLPLEAVQLFDEPSWSGAGPPGFVKFSDEGRPIIEPNSASGIIALGERDLF
jgi:hypothetical protein